jgi:hypothetical protein
VLTRHASQAGRAGGSGRYVSDLLTVRGAAKPVKLMRCGLTGVWGDWMFLAASVGNRAPLSGGGGSRGVLPRRATTTPADPMRDARAANNKCTRRTVWRISQTRLHTESSVASVAVRLTVSRQLPQAATSCTHICAHSVDICVEAGVEAGKVIVPRVPTRQREGADNSRSLLRVSGSRNNWPSSDARRLRSHP